MEKEKHMEAETRISETIFFLNSTHPLVN
uniref:Uncharacterized protein n=1 Tax=Rhizophora mucronata TaxID=61149 RepID=A0A2P2NE55_RHIMU